MDINSQDASSFNALFSWKRGILSDNPERLLEPLTRSHLLIQDWTPPVRRTLLQNTAGP
jgi:hypothetical protein